MTSRPKRIVKPKIKDDEIYTPVEKRPRTSVSEAVKKGATAEAVKRGSTARRGRPLKKEVKSSKEITKRKLTDEYAAIYKRIHESVQADGKDDPPETTNGSDQLPKKRIPKPSFKLRIKEEESLDEDLDNSSDEYHPSDASSSDAEEEKVKYTPKKSPKKAVNEVERDSNSGSDIKRKVCKSMLSCTVC